MSGTRATARHPDDGTLVDLIDGELEPATARALRDHIHECDDCAGRHARLERRDAAIGALLDRSAAAIPGSSPPSSRPPNMDFTLWRFRASMHPCTTSQRD